MKEKMLEKLSRREIDSIAKNLELSDKGSRAVVIGRIMKVPYQEIIKARN